MSFRPPTWIPCAAAGLTCNLQGSVCANPSEGSPCLQGGPPCQALANSTATNLQCLPYPSQFGFGSYACLQPCDLSDPASGTSDCVDPLMTCTSLGGSGVGAVCFYNEGCAMYFGACSSSGIGDGVCVPYDSNVLTGLCYQATLDGGAPGTACDAYGNRQNGGFCNTTSYCDFGVCQAGCNAGTSGGPACAQDAGAGIGVGCQPIFGQTGNATDFGTCSVDCDFTSATGGGCTAANGVPEKCIPPAYLGLADATTGLCVGAPAPGAAFALGASCTPSPTLLDLCVDGALCVNGGLVPNGAGICTQLCTAVGAAGQAPCAVGQVCDALFGAETDEGYCGLPDGGLGG